MVGHITGEESCSGTHAADDKATTVEGEAATARAVANRSARKWQGQFAMVRIAG